MRTVRRNEQKMYYSLLIGESPEYKLDRDGNKIVIYVDDEGVEHYQETGKSVLEYSKPVEFKASISHGGANADVMPFGISVGDYDAVIVLQKNAIPIDETSVIWYKSEIKYKDADETIVDVKSADYTVVKVTPSLNTTRYELKAIVK